MKKSKQKLNKSLCIMTIDFQIRMWYNNITVKGKTDNKKKVRGKFLMGIVFILTSTVAILNMVSLFRLIIIIAGIQKKLLKVS
jgi:hypothetical protein